MQDLIAGKLTIVGAALAVVGALTVGAPAQLDAGQSEDESEPGGIDAQTFRPAGGPGGLLQLESAETGPHLQPYTSLYLDAFSDPVVLRYDDRREPVVDYRMNAHLLVGLGVADDVQFELGMPVALVNRGEYRDRPIDGLGPADLQGRAKAMLFSSLDRPVGLGAVLDLTVPTGRADTYRGAGTPTVTPGLIADTRVDTPAGSVVVATNFGARLQRSRPTHDLRIGSALTYGAGAELEVMAHRWSLGVDVFGSVGLSEVRRETSPMEVVAGTSLWFTPDLKGTVGGGAGLVGGVGSPDWRGLVGLEFSPRADGPEPIEDVEPPVPAEQPEADVDCPPEPEGFEGPRDEDGCPVTPETFTGCDDLDDDWQGAVDRWGCPLIDSDGDGLVVWEDDCPHEPIEFIGVGQQDGCPDYDIDGDGVLNVQDHCPYEPGLRVYDGCPPPEDEQVVERVEDEEFDIEEKVHFESDKAIIDEDSHALLEEVAMVLRDESDVLLVEIAGHTDDRGDPDYNMMLSEERAKAVREFLIERGNLNPARLTAEGYGEEEPIVDGQTDEARARNRRVEFRIVETGEEGEAEQLAPVDHPDIE